jgi:Fic family protein
MGNMVTDAPAAIPGTWVAIPRPRMAGEPSDFDAKENRPSHIHAFLPDPLPPEFAYTPRLIALLSRAMHALGRLDAKASDLANPLMLIGPMRNYEAVTSSRIEGTVAELDSLTLFQEERDESSGGGDLREVANYVDALTLGLNLPNERPVSSALIRELHAVLMASVPGPLLDPGHFRERQVIVGRPGDRPEQAAFVPPPPSDVAPLMSDLDAYLTSDDEAPPLVKIALAHYQFEAIHPFNDGNGRVGRILIAILLKRWNLLTHPCLDLSAHVLRSRDGYIRALQRVSHDGDWSGWLTYFLTAVEAQATDTLRRVDALMELRGRYIERLRPEVKSSHLELLIDDLFQHQRLTAMRVQNVLDVSEMTARRVLAKLVELRIVEERTGRKRNRIYIAPAVIAIVESVAT